MMKFSRSLAATILLFGLLASGPVAADGAPCDNEGYVIAFFNGVDNTYEQAGEAVIALEAAYGLEYHGQKLSYTICYNPTDGFLGDLAEVFKQKSQESGPALWELYWDFVSVVNAGIQYWKTGDLFAAADAYDAVLAKYTNAAPQDVVDTLVGQLRTRLADQQKILAVAHSQGNLFVNAVADQLSAQLTAGTDSFRVVHVAPASQVPANRPYILSTTDLVIAGLAKLGPGLPQANVPIDLTLVQSATTSLGHSFVDLYMSPSYPARQMILDAMNSQLAALKLCTEAQTCCDVDENGNPTCVDDVTTDSEHCGDCETKCDAGDDCVDSKCDLCTGVTCPDDGDNNPCMQKNKCDKATGQCAVKPIDVTCGNNKCECGETAAGCPSDCKSTPGMATLPGGSFMMGPPQHQVTLFPFELDMTEVTVSAYAACASCSPTSSGPKCNSGVTGKGNHPVNCVTWEQAATYCQLQGGGKRLPTEAEWEYAARSGGKDQDYPWGDDKASCSYAVMWDGKKDGCGTGSTWPVCSLVAGNSSQGVCDLAGNVWEFCADWYGEYAATAVMNPTGPSSGSTHVVRGGSFYDNTNQKLDPTGAGNQLLANGRFQEVPGVTYDVPLGFRCARSIWDLPNTP